MHDVVSMIRPASFYPTLTRVMSLRSSLNVRILSCDDFMWLITSSLFGGDKITEGECICKKDHT
jgi:hypothetical protein